MLFLEWNLTIIILPSVILLKKVTEVTLPLDQSISRKQSFMMGNNVETVK